MFLVAFVCVHIILSVSKQDSLIKLRRGVKWGYVKTLVKLLSQIHHGLQGKHLKVH